MNTVSIRNLGLAIFLSVSFGAVQPLVRAAQPPAQAGAVNISKDVMEKKGTITWHDAPAQAIPDDVCTILQACTGKTKLLALPAATEDGQRVTRGLFLTQDSKHADVVVLERQTPSDRYYYLVSADGKLQKAAFVQLGSKSWSPIAASLAQPQFDKEAKVWHDHVIKLGAAPAAAPAAGN